MGNVRIVSTRPEADGSLGPVLRGESDFLVVDVEGNYAGRLPQDAAMYRTHGRHFRHHPDRGYKTPGTEEHAHNCALCRIGKELLRDLPKAPMLQGPFETVPGTEGGFGRTVTYTSGSGTGGSASVALHRAERIVINGVPFVRERERTGVPIEHVDERLKAILMQAGEEWGPRGVAEAAAQMAGWVGPF